jgi:hypothetical protein
MATGSRWGFLVLVFVIGLAAGFGLGFYAAPQMQPRADATRVQEFVGEARHVNFASDALEFEVHYPAAYVDPPELTILTEEMNHGFDYQLVEQRRDGFRIKIGSSMRRADKPDGSPWLRYRVKGVPDGSAAP